MRRRKACPIWSVALVDAPSAGGDPAGRLHVLHHQLRCPEDPSCSGWALWPHSRGDLSPWHCFALHRGPPRSSSSDPDFVVVDGVPVMLPSYDEAVSGGFSALGPGYLASVGQGCPLPVDDQSPPAYPGSGDTDTGPGESETCDSVSGSSELLQSLYSPPTCQGGTHPASNNPDTAPSTVGEVASTSPGIDIADGKHQPQSPSHPCAAHPPTLIPAQSQIRASLSLS